MEYSNLFVCLMGVCTVFIGLICIIILVSIMSAIIRRVNKTVNERDASENLGDAVYYAKGISDAKQKAGEITPELVAAVSAVIAEDMGADVSAIRICSMKKANA